MRVVIASSDPSYSDVLQNLLRSHGHETEQASNGLECVEALHHWRPDILVIGTELLWGGIEGILASMQEEEWLANTPVLLMIDGYENATLKHHSMAASTVHHPTGLSDLARRIECLAPRSESGPCNTFGGGRSVHSPHSLN